VNDFVFLLKINEKVHRLRKIMSIAYPHKQTTTTKTKSTTLSNTNRKIVETNASRYS